MPANQSKIKQIKMVPKIKIINNQIINSESTSQDSVWQERKQKQSKRTFSPHQQFRLANKGKIKTFLLTKSLYV